VVRGVAPAMRGKGVQDVTWAELAALDVGVWRGDSFTRHHVAPIADIFALLRGGSERRLYLDIKNLALPQLASLVAQAGVQGQIILASSR